jgi:hypothetical protein
MCSLCGVLGGSEHWTDSVARPGVFTRNTDPVSRRLERMHRIVLANRILKHFGMTLSDWQSTSYLLSTATGKTEIIDTLSHLWASAEALCGRPCDPLDPHLVNHFETADG